MLEVEEKKRKFSINKPTSFFTLLIGDYGAILVCGKAYALEMRSYFPDTSAKNIQDLQEILSADPQIPVYILIDILDQTYNTQSLPAVSSFSVGSLVKKRLERDFPENSITGSLYIDRSTTGRKDWNYLFVGSPYNPPVSTWIEAALAMPNIIKRIGFLPVESETLFKKLNKNIYNKSESPHKIQMLVMHTKVGGIRQVVYKKGRIIFSRLIALDNVDDENVVAGQFEQEIQNTLQYLGRTSKSNEKIEIFVICSALVKTALSNNKEFHLYTPYEISQDFGFRNAIMQNDKFADVLMIMAYSNSKQVLQLKTKETFEITKQHLIYKLSRYSSVLIALFLIINIIFYFATTGKIALDIASESSKLTEIQQRIENRKKETKIDEGESLKIIEVTEIYKSLSSNIESPKVLLERVAETIRDDAIIKSFDWVSNDSPKSGSMVQQSLKPKDPLEVTINVSFNNTGSSYQELFKNFDSFVKKIEKEFANFQVEYTRINQQITFQETKQQIPVSIILRGPKK